MCHKCYLSKCLIFIDNFHDKERSLSIKRYNTFFTSEPAFPLQIYTSMKKFYNLCCTNKLATTGNQPNYYLDNLNVCSELCDVRSTHSEFINSHLDDRLTFESLESNLLATHLSSSSSQQNVISNSVSDEQASDLNIILNLNVQCNGEFNQSLKKNHDRTIHSSPKLVTSLINSLKARTLNYLIRSSSFFNYSKCSSFNQRSFYLIFTIILLLLNTSSAGLVRNDQNALISPQSADSIFEYSNGHDILVTEPSSMLTTIKRYPREDQPFNIQVSGIRIEGEKVEIKSDQITYIYSDHDYTILLYGVDFLNYSSDALLLSITPVKANRGEDCSINSKDVYNLTVITNTIAKAQIKFDASDADKSNHYFICIDYKSKSVHQGSENWMRIHVQNKLLPLWLQIFFIFILLCLAGLFSGLNLGLMALDLHELEVIESCGTATEKRYARRIKPVRKRGNYLLCTILLGNVMVQTTLTVLLEDLTSGLIAVIGSTFSIVVFGEIVPQAICSRQGLAIGANTVFLMWFFMLLTFPISYPISWALDRILGKEIGKIYDRDRLTEYLRITQRYNKLDSDELNIIQGALQCKKITVAEIMTKLEDIFSLPAKSVLNFNTLTMIQNSGYSRIPVYDTDRSNIVAVLFAKDLAFVDPDDKIPIQTLCQYYKHEISYIFADATCHTAFKLFKEGKSHMAFVVRVSEEKEEKDPHYEVLGLVTLEDVLEEVLQTEIVDETDVLTDNRRKKRRKEVDSRIDYAEFCLLNSESQHVVSPQMVLVSYQYLSTSVYAFSKRFITESVLRRLINQNVYHKEDPISYYSDIKICKLYEQGKSYDYFVLILEGYVQVTVSKENLMFQSGPFTIFGSSALKLQDEDNLTIESLESQMNEPFEWMSDYTVEVVEKVTYLKLNRKLYISAVKQSLEQSLNILPHEYNENSLSKSTDFQNAFNGLKMKFVNDKKG